VIGYDVTRLTSGGVTVEHHGGKIETDGPWLICYRAAVGSDPADIAELIAPAHAVVSVVPCRGDGRCGDDGG
jgi:hypothetical protein